MRLGKNRRSRRKKRRQPIPTFFDKIKSAKKMNREHFGGQKMTLTPYKSQLTLTKFKLTQSKFELTGRNFQLSPRNFLPKNVIFSPSSPHFSPFDGFAERSS